MKDYFSHNTSEMFVFETHEIDKSYRAIVHSHFSALKGANLKYFGADSSENAFKVDGIAFKVLEDPDDGYRSHLGAIEYGEESNAIFFQNPIAEVRIETYDELSNHDNSFLEEKREGYRLVDIEDGHVWLEFGTDNTDDYYPYFIFRHMPKEIA